MIGLMTMMDVATGHITEEAAVYLTDLVRSTDHRDRLIVYEKGEYGWFVHVSDDLEDNLTSFTCLNDILASAHHRNCDWVMLDTDGAEWPELPTYEW